MKSSSLGAGSIRVQVDGSGETDLGDFKFRLRQDFGVDVVSRRLRLTLVGSPDIDVTSGGRVVRTVLSVFNGTVENAVEKAAAAIIPSASSELNKAILTAIGVFVVTGAVVRFLPRIPQEADLSDAGLHIGFTCTIQVPAAPDVIEPVRTLAGALNERRIIMRSIMRPAMP